LGAGIQSIITALTADAGAQYTPSFITLLEPVPVPFSSSSECYYRLCPDCEETLAARLSAQDAKLAPTLLAYRLESSRCHNVTATGEPPAYSRSLGCLPLAAALLLWLAIAWPLIVAPALRHVLVIMPTVNSSDDEQDPWLSSFTMLLPVAIQGCLPLIFFHLHEVEECFFLQLRILEL
jgi:hypothetical protein